MQHSTVRKARTARNGTCNPPPIHERVRADLIRILLQQLKTESPDVSLTDDSLHARIHTRPMVHPEENATAPVNKRLHQAPRTTTLHYSTTTSPSERIQLSPPKRIDALLLAASLGVFVVYEPPHDILLHEVCFSVWTSFV